MTLHADHISGNRLDNRIENLRFFCPSRHSQTDDFAGEGKSQGS
ncbi:HNH endonuclease [Microtetraspora malaysiensis]